MVREGVKLAIERSEEEATKGCVVVIFGCLQTLLTGGFLASPLLLSNQPSPFVLSLSLSPHATLIILITLLQLLI
jgi:hypothetical protein